MSDTNVGPVPFKRPTPKTRDEALQYIEALMSHFDIEHDEDFLLNVIDAQAAKFEEQTAEFTKQVAGMFLDACNMTSIAIKVQDLLDRKPFDIDVEETTKGKTKFTLKGFKK